MGQVQGMLDETDPFRYPNYGAALVILLSLHGYFYQRLTQSIGLYSHRQVTEVKLGQERSNSGWVTLEASPNNSPCRSSKRDVKLEVLCLDGAYTVGLN